jgi:hypothetical protein
VNVVKPFEKEFIAMDAVIFSRRFTESASSKERRSAIANDPVRSLDAVFGPIPEEQPGDRSPHHRIADKLATEQVRLAGLIAVALRV